MRIIRMNVVFSILALAFSTQTLAYDVLINVKGTITNSSCDVDSRSENFDVELGNVSLKNFTGTGSVSPPKKFQIILTNCSASASAVKIGFFGNEDSGNSDLLALTPGGAAGLGIGIYDDDKNLIPINEYSKKYALNLSVDNVLTFHSRYVSSSDNVTAGIANSIATFKLEYD